MNASRTTVLIATFALAACKGPRTPEAPRVEIVSTSTASAWIVAREGLAISTRDKALWVFVEPAFNAETRALPGIALGNEKGPRYGLLSGYFAPMIAAAASDRSYPTHIELQRDRAVITMGPDLRISLRAHPNNALAATIEGRAVLLPLADDTEVRTFKTQKMVSALHLTAGDEPSALTHDADRLEVENKRSALLWTVETECPRVITPTKRGSTSVFAVAIGPNPVLQDPLFGLARDPARDAAPQDGCTASKTSTLTISHP